ncbi:MAG: long-chain fatty acid--CoA ligase [Deltaproteobacteria bacterium]|nr:long-chain fatty acid--CoA ligase [Deltaproteobacteria bacterium]
MQTQGRERGDQPAYFEKEAGRWIPTSYREYAVQVRTAAKALIHLGLGVGQTVSILGFNRPEWAIFDVATMSAGGAPAGIYTTSSPNEVQYIIHHADSRIVLLENEAQWKKVESELERLPNLQHVVMMKGAEHIKHPKVMTWADFMALGDRASDATFDDRLERLEKNQLATLIYTSGTTGPPKGVMLSHENLAWTAGLVRQIIEVRKDDCSLSYLPLSHIAEQMFSLHVPITYGSSVYFAESLEKVPDNLKEVQPTIFFGVPRIWEKFHAGVSAKLRMATGMKKQIAVWATGVGSRMHDARNVGRAPGALLGLEYRLATKLVFSKVKPALGLARVRHSVSGAAPISKDVLDFFAGLDIPIREVYGQSEGSGPTSFNQPGRTRFGSVGPAIPGVEIKFADDGEIRVKGPNVFLGYYKEELATKEALVDGWLCSGDLGKLDADGYLHITGRKKEIIITAGGKNIAPKNIEGALKSTALIGEAVVIGDRRKFLSALLFLDDEAAKKWAEDKGVSSDALRSNAALLDRIQQDVDRVNAQFAQVEHIRKWKIPGRNLGIDTGELTPTLKVKRAKVYAHFAEEIESMYRDASESG